MAYVWIIHHLHPFTKWDAQPSTLNQPSPKSWGLEVLVQRIHEAANAQQEDECHSHREANTIGERCQHVGQENAILRAPRTMLCPKKKSWETHGGFTGMHGRWGMFTNQSKLFAG